MERSVRGLFLMYLSAVALVGTCFLVGSAYADDLGEKQDDLEELQEKRDSYQKIVNLKANQEAMLNSQIHLLAKQTDTLQSNIDENSKKLEETTQKISLLESQIVEKERTIEDQKKVLSDLIRSYYDWNTVRTQKIVFAEDMENPFTVGDQEAQLQDGVSDVVEKIQSLKQSLVRDQESLIRDKTETETLNAKLEQQTVYLENTKQQKQLLAAQTTEEKSQYQKKLSKVEEQIRDVEQEIQNLEADKSNSIDMSKLPSKKSADFEYPVENVKITQGYGKTGFTRYYTFHNGVDFGISTGTKVMAVADGKVLATGDCGSKYAYGKWVAIDHGNGLVSFYGHLSKHKVSKGDKVDQGDTIGLSGNTGYSTGPHLHFSIFTRDSFEVINSKVVVGVKIPTGAHINPMKYLP